MRKTYRSRSVKEYWTSRWEDIPVDAPMMNEDVYPLKYAIKTVKRPGGRTLEAGCGAGRILRYFHARDYDIVGIDYISGVVDKLSAADPSLKVAVGDITNLQFADSEFDDVLAFGLYHNIENDLDRAVSETYRVLRSGGAVCASFRADNVQTRLIDLLADRRGRSKDGSPRIFHKMNLTRAEFEKLFRSAGFRIEFVEPVENMPILYKLKFFRANTHRNFDENNARKEGYRLSWLGGVLQSLMMRVAPDQFCNVYVLIARKP